MKEFVQELTLRANGIKQGEPVIYCGDLNVNRFQGSDKDDPSMPFRGGLLG